MARAKLRILIAKIGLDGHDRGAKVIVRALRDAGMEIIYTGLHQSAESVCQAAIDEDVDAVGLSILSGAHMSAFTDLLWQLRQQGAAEIAVFGGGVIPDEDRAELLEIGVRELFGPGCKTEEIVSWISSHIENHRAKPLGTEITGGSKVIGQNSSSKDGDLPSDRAGSKAKSLESDKK